MKNWLDTLVCVQCKLPVHLPCGKGIGEEGYGQSVLCKNCGEATEDAQTTSKETSNEFVLVNDDLDDVVKTQEIPENILGVNTTTRKEHISSRS